jgi:Fe-S-cluster containining protein
MESHDQAPRAELGSRAADEVNASPSPPSSHRHEGCGNCCIQVGIPPFRFKADGIIVDVVVRDNGEEKIVSDTDELPLPDGMPAELVQELAKLAPLGLESKSIPCIWFNPETRKCKHYAFRPNICRTFDCRGDANRFWRESLKRQQNNESR